MVDLRTGERLSRPEEESQRAKREAEARRAANERAERAERQAESAARALAEALLAILDNRGLDVDAAARKRILECRDLQDLRHWTERAFAVSTVDDLWNVG